MEQYAEYFKRIFLTCAMDYNTADRKLVVALGDNTAVFHSPELLPARTIDSRWLYKGVKYSLPTAKDAWFRHLDGVSRETLKTLTAHNELAEIAQAQQVIPKIGELQGRLSKVSTKSVPLRWSVGNFIDVALLDRHSPEFPWKAFTTHKNLESVTAWGKTAQAALDYLYEALKNRQIRLTNGSMAMAVILNEVVGGTTAQTPPLYALVGANLFRSYEGSSVTTSLAVRAVAWTAEEARLKTNDDVYNDSGGLLLWINLRTGEAATDV